MTALIVLILTLMWAVVLVPPLLRSRNEGRPSSSVVSFRRQLSTLQRTGPASIGRVPSRSAGRSSAPVNPYRIAPHAMVPQPDRAVRGQVAYRTGSRPIAAASYRVSNRSAIRRRRQHVLVTLSLVAFGTGLLGFGMGVRQAAIVNVIVDLALAGYIYALVQLRQHEDQRAMRQLWSDAA